MWPLLSAFIVVAAAIPASAEDLATYANRGIYIETDIPAEPGPSSFRPATVPSFAEFNSFDDLIRGIEKARNFKCRLIPGITDLDRSVFCTDAEAVQNLAFTFTMDSNRMPFADRMVLIDKVFTVRHNKSHTEFEFADVLTGAALETFVSTAIDASR